MSLKNLDRINAVSDIHAKFQRAIGAGSKGIFEALKNKMNTQGTALASNAIELENHENRSLIISSLAEIKDRKAGFGLRLMMSIRDAPKNCGVSLRFFASAMATGDAPFGLTISCTLTEEGGERWNVSMNGSCLTILGDIVEMVNERNLDGISETEALMFVKKIAKELGNLP